MSNKYAKYVFDISDRLFKYAEPVATMVSGAVAEPLSGLYGLYQLARTQNPNAAANAVNQAQQAMTYQPRTEAGQAGLRGLQEILAPIGETIQGASQNLGDKAYNATGSPALAAAAYSAPTVMLEALGLKGLNIARKPVAAADLYSARMGMGDIEGADSALEILKDESGNPRTFYHGTSANFDEFKLNPDASNYRDSLASKEGVHFTSSIDEAAGYGSIVKRANLVMKNPARYSSSDILRIEDELRSQADYIEEAANQIKHNEKLRRRFMDRLGIAEPEIYKSGDGFSYRADGVDSDYEYETIQDAMDDYAEAKAAELYEKANSIRYELDPLSGRFPAIAAAIRKAKESGNDSVLINFDLDEFPSEHAIVFDPKQIKIMEGK